MSIEVFPCHLPITTHAPEPVARHGLPGCQSPQLGQSCRKEGHLFPWMGSHTFLTGTTLKSVRPHPGEQVTLFAARLAQLGGLTPRQTVASHWFRRMGCDG